MFVKRLEAVKKMITASAKRTTATAIQIRNARVTERKALKQKAFKQFHYWI